MTIFRQHGYRNNFRFSFCLCLCFTRRRLQNSPYFCEFKYARAVRLLRHALQILYWFWGKNRLFCSLHKTRLALQFPAQKTSSYIWVAKYFDWAILYWHACGADGRAGGWRAAGGRSDARRIKVKGLPWSDVRWRDFKSLPHFSRMQK